MMMLELLPGNTQNSKSVNTRSHRALHPNAKPMYLDQQCMADVAGPTMYTNKS